jgi:hypothetical protein
MINKFKLINSDAFKAGVVWGPVEVDVVTVPVEVDVVSVPVEVDIGVDCVTVEVDIGVDCVTVEVDSSNALISPYATYNWDSS